MKCKIFKSEKQEQSYLYLASHQEFDELPEALRQSFGEPEFVMDLDLAQTTRLARVDKFSVIESLKAKGFFLQLPPRVPVEEEISAWLK